MCILIRRRKAAESVVDEEAERFRALVQHASDVVTVFGADGRVQYQSPSVERVLGYQPEHFVIGDPWFAVRDLAGIGVGARTR